MTTPTFSLTDKYTKTEGQIAITGLQALVRLPMEQYWRDQASKIRTGTFITGYQGSPLGDVDRQMKGAGGLLKDHNIHFESGINEDIAATAIYGTQMLEMFPHSQVDGIVGMWFGKGPGIDRTGDAFRHASYLGTSKNGAALVLGGDDPACKSSTIPSDSVVALYDVNFPTFYPANPEEVLEFGLHGIALSRYSGLWSALKIVTNVADGGAIIDVGPGLAPVVLPELEFNGKPFDKAQIPSLLSIASLENERKIYYERMEAAMAYIRVNKLDKIMVQGKQDKIGLVAAGKTYNDTIQALETLGLGTEELKSLGIRIYKLAVIAPVEPQGLWDFAEGLEEILVVEEKRGFTEILIRDALYNKTNAPRVYGKRDATGGHLFPGIYEMQVDQIARILADYLAEKFNRPEIKEQAAWLEEIEQRPVEMIPPRTPYFCSGCPHNTSTTLPEGDVAGGGIGCHAMAMMMNRNVMWLTHMGGEGAPWIGLSPFVDKDHIFQNVGDGTYFHSASKAVEALVASGQNITFKILYNAAVAMTGGQSVVGQRSPADLALQLSAEGVKKIVVVAEDIKAYRQKYPNAVTGGTISLEPKSKYNAVMEDLREIKGVTAIIFDQQCAAEKRRERKRGIQPTPKQRVFINPSVCEGCGDCGVKSNCLSVVPIQTEFGRKTAIHQSSCNMDYSCLQGDCPAFMTIELKAGAKPVKKTGVAAHISAGELPEPAHKADLEKPYKILMVGVGGTGVVTADALLVTAALMEGRYAVHLDQTGLAQKGGAVVSNLTLSEKPVTQSNKISAGETDLLVAFDILAALSRESTGRFHPERTTAVVNTTKMSTAQEVTDIHTQAPSSGALKEKLDLVTRTARNTYLRAEDISEALFGDHMATNLFMLGVAYQSGLLPLAAESLEQAISANGVFVEQNHQAFRWGRMFIHQPEMVNELMDGSKPTDPKAEAKSLLQSGAPGSLPAFETMLASSPEPLKDLMAPRLAGLILYQNIAYAQGFLDEVKTAFEAERQATPGKADAGGFAAKMAKGLFKLMAYKDEYEVARLWLTDPIWEKVGAMYDQKPRRYFQLHPPLLKSLGMKDKIRLGAWFTPVMGLLARAKRLRGTPFDVFGYAKHRSEERALIGWYQTLMQEATDSLTPETHATALALAFLPDGIRGYENLKTKNIAQAKAEAENLLETLRTQASQKMAG